MMTKKRLLIIGCGDVALRVAALLAGRCRVYGLIRDAGRVAQLRRRGIVPILGDLDRRGSLLRLAGIGEWVLHAAPPPASGHTDPRTRRLIAALVRNTMLPQRLAYISTSGVYGDCGGAVVDESRRLAPRTERAWRRVDTERRLRAWSRTRATRLTLLRAPGIYAADRLPLDRLRAGTPALRAGDDPWTNHIHAADLARIVIAALRLGRGGRAYNACDDTRLKMGEYFDLVADRFGLPRPPRIARSAAAQRLSAAALSFTGESRRLVNTRIKRELRVRLRWPTVADTLQAIAPDGGANL